MGDEQLKVIAIDSVTRDITLIITLKVYTNWLDKLGYRFLRIEF